MQTHKALCPYPTKDGRPCHHKLKLTGGREDGREIGFSEGGWIKPDRYYDQQAIELPEGHHVREIISHDGRAFYGRARAHIIKKHGYNGSPWDPACSCYDQQFESLTLVSVDVVE